VARYRPEGPIYSSEVLAYDAVTLFADAVRRAGTLRRAKVRQALADTRGFEAVSGTIAFDRHGDPVKPAIVMKIENGRPVFLKRVDPSREHPPEAE
jgi:branched-chain amino acid transport system substrate-binding protein